MSVKPDKWIRQMALAHGMIAPFEPSQIRTHQGNRVISYGTSSYGYDVRCASEFKVFTNIHTTIVDPKNLDAASFVDINAEVCVIPPNSFALARSVEYFRIPRDVLGVCMGKSTYSRVGIVVSNTPLEPCFSSDTQILTRRGWRFFKALVIGSEVLTLNPETKQAEWQAVERIQAYFYRGNLLHFVGDSLDLLVTPDHHLYVDTPLGWHQEKAVTIFGKDGYRMNCQVNWLGTDIADEITIQFRRYPTNLFLKFLGLYLSFGSCYTDEKGNYCIRIATTGKDVAELFKQLEFIADYIHHAWQIHSQTLYKFLQPLGQAHERYIPAWIKALPTYRLQYLLTGLFTTVEELQIYTTSATKLADDVQEILFKVGSATTVHKITESSKVANGYPIANRDPFFEIHPSPLTLYATTHKEVPYTGWVYDVTVPNHLIFVRRNGKAVWSGNCWEGHITLEFSNTTPLPAKIYANEGVAQVIFLSADETCEISYLDRGGKYQGQTGVTLPKT